MNEYTQKYYTMILECINKNDLIKIHDIIDSIYEDGYTDGVNDE
jgi:hypothetical protein